MAKLAVVLSVIFAVLVVESNCQARFIYPTYRPPSRPSRPIIRQARQANDEPLWIYKGDDVIRAPSSQDHPVLPAIIDDVKLGPTRHARSLGTPGRGRVGSNDRGSRGNRGQDAGATHPGYNRRNTRSLHLPDYVTTPPFNPKPWPGFPKEKPKFPIYV